MLQTFNAYDKLRLIRELKLTRFELNHSKFQNYSRDPSSFIKILKCYAKFELAVNIDFPLVDFLLTWIFLIVHPKAPKKLVLSNQGGGVLVPPS